MDIEKFIKNQETLGKEFEEVIQDNLWELMVHTNKEESEKEISYSKY